MYLITIYNSGTPTVIHGDFAHVADCSVVKEVNATDSMSFTVYPGNPGYDALHEFSTTIKCIDTGTGEVVFEGRVLLVGASMDSDGSSCKSVTCEGLRGYLNDSVQPYTEERTWKGDSKRNGLQEYIDYLLANHNAHVPKDKRVYRGIVTVQTFKTTENVTKSTNFERTSDIIKDKIVDVFGGESRVRRGDDGLLYLDYAEKLGEEHPEEISVGRNMETARREIKPDQLITRLYPRGAKLTKTETDDSGNNRDVETEDRLGIESVNGGCAYIEDAAAVKAYGIIEGVNEWDDVTDPANLREKASAWLKSNNQIPASTTITGYDLSMLGYEPDRIRIHGWYPCRNPLVGIDEMLEVVKQTVNVSEPADSTWEFGETKATRTAIMSSISGIASAVEHAASQAKTASANIAYCAKYAEASASSAGKAVDSISMSASGSIGGKASITLSVGGKEISGEIDMSRVREAFRDDATAVTVTDGLVEFAGNTLAVSSTHLNITSEGEIEATSGKVGGMSISEDGLSNDAVNIASEGLEFACGGSTIGAVKADGWMGDQSKPGMIAELEADSAYACLACRKSADAGEPAMVAAYAVDDVGGYAAGFLHVGAPVQLHGSIDLSDNSARRFWIDPESGGCAGGVTGTLQCAIYKSIDKDGTVTEYAGNACLQFKNGMLVGVQQG